MNASEYVSQIVRCRSRPERKRVLEQVPYHLRDKLKAEVEHKWKSRNTRNK